MSSTTNLLEGYQTYPPKISNSSLCVKKHYGRKNYALMVLVGTARTNNPSSANVDQTEVPSKCHQVTVYLTY